MAPHQQAMALWWRGAGCAVGMPNQIQRRSHQTTREALERHQKLGGGGALTIDRACAPWALTWL